MFLSRLPCVRGACYAPDPAGGVNRPTSGLLILFGDDYGLGVGARDSFMVLSPRENRHPPGAGAYGGRTYQHHSSMPWHRHYASVAALLCAG